MQEQMKEQTSVTTEQAHGNLNGLILNGRILINGLPLTANEIAALLRGEQMLFEKAMKFDQAVALAAKKQAEEEAKKEEDSRKPPVHISK